MSNQFTSPPALYDATCLQCQIVFRADRNNGKGKFCSRACYHASLMGRVRQPLEERFWAKVEKTDYCWLWTGSKDCNGYGRIQTGTLKKQNPVSAHRLSWQIANGEIPEGLFLCHVCDNPSCVNPEHLFLGTQTDNMQDCSRKRRTTFGDKAFCAKLTWEQADAMRLDFGNGLRRKDIALKYSTPYQTVVDILQGKTWQR